jgi:tetratricopeptide (TPR) repeat protein
MWSRFLATGLLSLALLTPARARTEAWLQIISPHFVVVTNSGEKQGRRIADQFERMRSLFHVMFPKLPMETAAEPIMVLAVKGEKDFRALEPEAYLAKGSLKLGGLFLPAIDKNYILMQVDAEGEHPYSVIYHEYTHFLLRKSAEWMPLWMNEGLAEFYQNTDIREREASLGEPSGENIGWLRRNPLLPLPTLFLVDQHSPYYHQEHKGSIFYAESWALVHMIEIGDLQQKTERLNDYLNRLAHKVDPVTAATQAFGDLQKLQADLNDYLGHISFKYLRLPVTTEVNDSAFLARPLTSIQADAIRADFLAYNSRTSEAQALLDQVLREDPKNLSAFETKGYLEYRQGDLVEAKKCFARAVELDSQSFVAHYYFAAITMSTATGTGEQEQVESSLRTSIKLNPSFAPAMDRLAVYLAMRRRNLDEAHLLELNAIGLEPVNVAYRLNMANLLLEMEQGERAIEVLKAAAKVAKTSGESASVDQALNRAQTYLEARAKFTGPAAPVGNGTITTGEIRSDPSVPRLRHREFVAKGPHLFLVGVLKSVHCDNPALDLTLSTQEKQLALHVDNYYGIAFTTLGFEPSGDLNPCKDLENRPAKVEYVESADPSVRPQVISVELHH